MTNPLRDYSHLLCGRLTKVAIVAWNMMRTVAESVPTKKQFKQLTGHLNKFKTLLKEWRRYKLISVREEAHSAKMKEAQRAIDRYVFLHGLTQEGGHSGSKTIVQWPAGERLTLDMIKDKKSEK